MKKGQFYKVKNHQLSYMANDMAEYHSTSYRKCDGKPLHHMLIRSVDGSLETMIFLDEELEEGRKEENDITIFMPSLPALGSDSDWHKGFYAGAKSMRDEYTKAIKLACSGIPTFIKGGQHD